MCHPSPSRSFATHLWTTELQGAECCCTIGRFRKPTHKRRRSSIDTNDKVQVLGVKFAVPCSSLTQDLYFSGQAETQLCFNKNWLLRKAMTEFFYNNFFWGEFVDLSFVWRRREHNFRKITFCDQKLARRSRALDGHAVSAETPLEEPVWTSPQLRPSTDITELTPRCLT